MVKITHSMEETAQFLHAITQRLIQKVRTDSVSFSFLGAFVNLPSWITTVGCYPG